MAERRAHVHAGGSNTHATPAAAQSGLLQIRCANVAHPHAHRIPHPAARPATHRAVLEAARHVVVVQGHHIGWLALELAGALAVVQVDGGQDHPIEGIVQQVLHALLVRVPSGVPALGALELGAVWGIQVVVAPGSTREGEEWEPVRVRASSRGTILEVVGRMQAQLQG